MKNVFEKTKTGIVKAAAFLSVTRSTRPQKLPEPRYPFLRG